MSTQLVEELARHEVPKVTVEKRSAISIVRRLQTHWQNTVKIDAKSIGVGQYRHDVNQKN